IWTVDLAGPPNGLCVHLEMQKRSPPRVAGDVVSDGIVHQHLTCPGSPQLETELAEGIPPGDEEAVAPLVDKLDAHRRFVQASAIPVSRVTKAEVPH
ncbi:MAG: hypothetical protein ACRDTT_35235, partial [Pseudonocardiaceae bacterium]